MLTYASKKQLGKFFIFSIRDNRGGMMFNTSIKALKTNVDKVESSHHNTIAIYVNQNFQEEMSNKFT